MSSLPKVADAEKESYYGYVFGVSGPGKTVRRPLVIRARWSVAVGSRYLVLVWVLLVCVVCVLLVFLVHGK